LVGFALLRIVQRWRGEPRQSSAASETTGGSL